MMNFRSRVLRVDPANPSPATIMRSVAILQEGGLVAFPTDTLYALGADGLSAEAVGRLTAAKGRDPGRPIPLFVRDIAMAERLVTHMPPLASGLAERFWPGALMLVLPARAGLPGPITAGTERVGLRVPDSLLCLALLERFDRPITGTSANRSGGMDPTRAEQVQQALGDALDLLLDGGTTAIGFPSTVIDPTTHPPTILRHGAIPSESLLPLLGQL